MGKSASSKKGGVAMAQANVCKTPPTPPVPVPYPSIAQLGSTDKPVAKVVLENKEKWPETDLDKPEGSAAR